MPFGRKNRYRRGIRRGHTVPNRDGSRKRDALGDVRADAHVYSDALGKPATGKREQHAANASIEPHFLLVAANAFQVALCHEVAGADRMAWIEDEDAVGANGLIAVMFERGALAENPG